MLLPLTSLAECPKFRFLRKKEDESKRKFGKALEDDAMTQHETKLVKASPLYLQGDENVAKEPEKEDESKTNVAEDADGMYHSRKLLVQ